MSKPRVNRKRLHRMACAALALLAASSVVSAQTYPSKQIEFVVQTSPGSGTDVFGRGVTDMLVREKLITQSIVVNNRVGGAGGVAYSYIKSKRGDPYVVLCTATNGVLLAAARPELNLGLENYTFLSFMAHDPQVIAVHSDLKVKTFKDLLDAGKREPNTLSMAMSSTLGVGRQLLYLMDKEAGAKFKLVVFKGGGEATTAAAGGHVSFTAENLSEMAGHVQGGETARDCGNGRKAHARIARYTDTGGTRSSLDGADHRARLFHARGRAEGSRGHHGSDPAQAASNQSVERIRCTQYVRRKVPHQRRTHGLHAKAAGRAARVFGGDRDAQKPVSKVKVS